MPAAVRVVACIGLGVGPDVVRSVVRPVELSGAVLGPGWQGGIRVPEPRGPDVVVGRRELSGFRSVDLSRMVPAFGCRGDDGGDREALTFG